METAIATVLVVTLLLGVVQFALFFHARAVAVTAARHGLDTARVLSGASQSGDEVARQFLAGAGAALVTPAVTVSRSATDATVTVSGTALSVLPGVVLPVTVTVSAPVERLVE